MANKPSNTVYNVYVEKETGMTILPPFVDTYPQFRFRIEQGVEKAGVDALYEFVGLGILKGRLERVFFPLNAVDVELISKLSDIQCIPCLYLTEEDMNRIIADYDKVRLYKDLRVLPQLEFWLEPKNSAINKYQEMLKTLRYYKKWNFDYLLLDDNQDTYYDILTSQLQDQLITPLFPSYEEPFLWNYWKVARNMIDNRYPSTKVIHDYMYEWCKGVGNKLGLG